MVAIASLVAIAMAEPDHGHAPVHHPHAPPHYNYQYAVLDDYHGTNFGHTEERDGYNTQVRNHEIVFSIVNGI